MKILAPARKTGLVLVGMLAVATFTAGCASMFSGTTQTVRVESDPPGATVMINNLDCGKTPVSYSFSKKRPEDGIFELHLEGYEPYAGSPHMDTNNLVWLNIFNYFIGMIIDCSTGAAVKYDDVMRIHLLPLAKLPPGAPSPLASRLGAPPPASATVMPVVGHAGSDDAYEQLKKLKDLKDKGILTDQEYELRRKPLLEKL